jgi:nicotinamide-nucleotide amidase
MFLMQRLILQIHKLLIKNKKTIAVAESCTGGLTSNLLTSTSGSSRYFMLGIVAYSNKAKEKVLRIPHKTIIDNGAVSSQVAKLMAKSVKSISRSDFGIGITGIAGPAGGSKTKPVGTVFIAIDSRVKKICERYCFTGSRLEIRKKAAIKTFYLLKSLII